MLCHLNMQLKNCHLDWFLSAIVICHRWNHDWVWRVCYWRRMKQCVGHVSIISIMELNKKKINKYLLKKLPLLLCFLFTKVIAPSTQTRWKTLRRTVSHLFILEPMCGSLHSISHKSCFRRPFNRLRDKSV